MLAIVHALPNQESADTRPLSDIVKHLQTYGGTVGIVGSGMWFDAENYDHLDQYEAAFHEIAKEISNLTGEVAGPQLGYDEETFEPVADLNDADLYGDVYYRWPGSNLLLLYAQEDKELNIDIALFRLSQPT